ncbi:MAG: prepilin-type N-terminal cleavage/methylation domain-containing protein [Deltaproteobacteria bacterium]|nr:prepilin-type N-terminal cleavage/methylation domain-containing protein [Deltaproteobacteria bacterium]
MHQKKTGFTLIELMISVAIIGILAVVAIPNYNKFKGKAYIADAHQGVDVFNKSEILFHIEYGTFLRVASLKWTNTLDTERRVAFASDTLSGDLDKLEALGWPIPQNAMVPYGLITRIGKTHEDGSEYIDGGGETWPVGFPWPGWQEASNPLFYITDRSSSICGVTGVSIIGSVTTAQLGAVEFARISSYAGRVHDWVSTMATVNVNLGDNYCTTIVSLVAYDGKDYSKTALIQIGDE